MTALLAAVFIAAALLQPFSAYAAETRIDFGRHTNYFYDRYYPESDPEGLAEPDRGPAFNYDRAVGAFEKKDLIKALFYLNNVLKYNMFSKEALNLYGVVLLIDNKHSDAREFFRKAIASRRSYKAPYMNLGLMAIKTESWRDLEAASTEYLRQDPEDFDAQLGMGIAAFHLFCYAESETYLDRAWQLSEKCEREEFLDTLREYRARAKAKNRRLY